MYINLWGTKECRPYMNLFVHESTGFIYYLIVTTINNLPKCFYLTTSCPSAPFVLLFNSRVLAFTLYLIPSGRLPCGVFLKKRTFFFFLIYWCLVLCSCVLSLLFRVPCVWEARAGGGRGEVKTLATSILTWIICTVCQNGLTHVSMKSSCWEISLYIDILNL